MSLLLQTRPFSLFLIHVVSCAQLTDRVTDSKHTSGFGFSARERFVKALNLYFQSKISIPRVRMGEQQEIETLINEEASLFAMFLRNERQSWKLRIAPLI